MEVHRPRPAHGWRELLREVGIIVLGVLIALGAEQVVRNLHMRAEVRLAESQMREEVSNDDGPQVLQRIALAPCIEQQLTRIHALAEQGGPRAALIEAIKGYDPPSHTWDSLAFQGATMSKVVPELPPERLWRWAYVYTAMPLLDRADEREFLDVAKLRALSQTGGALSDVERQSVLAAVELLRRDNAEIVEHATPVAAAVRELDIRVVMHPKEPIHLYAPAGAARVVEQLKRLPMAAACVAPLEHAMADIP
jgi:hypothetical protein